MRIERLEHLKLTGHFESNRSKKETANEQMNCRIGTKRGDKELNVVTRYRNLGRVMIVQLLKACYIEEEY